MKINGQKLETPNVEIVVIPRGGETPDIVFHAGAILDMSPFDKFCPEPVPPEKVVKGGKREKNFEDKGYKQALEKYGEKRMAWIIIESLRTTPDLEWETVKYDDHNTWLNYDKEFRNSGFSHVEIQRIQAGVFSANCLNEARLEEARANFLRGPQGSVSESCSLSIEQNSMSSGTPATG